MTRRRGVFRIAWAGGLIVAGVLSVASAIAADLIVEVTGLRSDAGKVHFALYDDPAAFPEYEGRVDGTLLARLVGDLEAHYLLCGPTRFMADLQTALERRNVPTEHIHTESFGPAG